VTPDPLEHRVLNRRVAQVSPPAGTDQADPDVAFAGGPG